MTGRGGSEGGGWKGVATACVISGSAWISSSLTSDLRRLRRQQRKNISSTAARSANPPMVPTAIAAAGTFTFTIALLGWVAGDTPVLVDEGTGTDRMTVAVTVDVGAVTVTVAVKEGEGVAMGVAVTVGVGIPVGVEACGHVYEK